MAQRDLSGSAGSSTTHPRISLGAEPTGETTRQHSAISGLRQNNRDPFAYLLVRLPLAWLARRDAPRFTRTTPCFAEDPTA